MKLKVTEEGVLIPKELLGDSQEVEITQQEDQTIIIRVNNSNISKVNDSKMSIWDLGKNPVECDITDASINHDKYIYNL
jgi:virulence-associated protein VagC